MASDVLTPRVHATRADGGSCVILLSCHVPLPSLPNRPAFPCATQVFKKGDKNSDGILSPDEFYVVQKEDEPEADQARMRACRHACEHAGRHARTERERARAGRMLSVCRRI
jgi:hypothetical protein